ncbi:MAG: multidrug RND transporter, partial [Spirochaetes bacterium]
LSFVPLFTGILWMMGLLGIIGMKINIFNSMVFPLILGIGIDDGILILTRFRETGNNDWETPLLFTGRAITMTSLTTMIAFGSLISASYPILSSIGFIILFGVGFCLLTSLFLLPSLLKEFVNVRNKKIESR